MADQKKSPSQSKQQGSAHRGDDQQQQERSPQQAGKANQKPQPQKKQMG